ncbi:N-acetyltransferase family 8 member 3-like [Microplitis mediator]|uniref:N-acetyltransferase family 8 member 3-like n=1 Tax=Microplitis mediator TaxID=375433 RepID=UPI0025565733|nr:N-acetyltransferase family 8 member 3-like [Microplitis mediator]
MSHIIVIREYKPGDELNCHDMMKKNIMSSLNTAFLSNVFKELTFQLMILSAAIMFIFFGLPFTFCLLVIPLIIIITYATTYFGFTMITAEINQELTKISRLYMSNAFSCFWVAEAFQPYTMTRNPADINYTVMTEKQFRDSNIDVSSQCKKIVGTIGLLKSHRSEKGAWIKRLCVDKNYRRKGVGSYLLSTAVKFAIDQGYSCVDLVFSEYTDGCRELCFKKGFELKQMYHKSIIGPIVNVLQYELTYQIKPLDDCYNNHYSSYNIYNSKQHFL